MNCIGLFLLSISLFFLSSCAKERVSDKELIQRYISNNNLDAKAGPAGLYYVMEQEGTGEQPSGVYSEVTVHYTGRLINGTQFDSSIGKRPFTTILTKVIKGWQYGIPLFKKGGKGKLILPSNLGYGSNGSGNLIPPNAVLIFDIELLNVKN